MRVNTSNGPSGYNSPINWYNRAILLIILILVLVTLIPPNHREKSPVSLQSQEFNADSSVPNLDEVNKPSSLAVNPSDSVGIRLGHKCNIFRGNWVPYPEGPLYTNRSGCPIEAGENCMMFGRPDTEFMKWRWKPDGCELPVFDPVRFLELVRGKSMAFVGDSVARNHMQSLQCLLSSVAHPANQSTTAESRVRRFHYVDYNFTVEYLPTTHLVKAFNVDPFALKTIHLHLDEVEDIWGDRVENLDYVIISSGHWFSRPLIYYEKGKVTGCNMCKENNLTDLTRYNGYRKAFQSSFSKFIDLRNFKGMVILRTISPTHFEPEFREGRGNCVRKKPFTRQELKLDWYVSMFHKFQMEEFWAAQREGRDRGLKFRVLDITEAMRLRPDAHPNHYGHPPNLSKKLFADCLHWCLPGAIDTWNELLLHTLEEDGEGSSDGKGIL